MPLVRVTRNFQVSIPKEVRAKLNIEEGDLVEVDERDGEIVLTPKKLIDADQAWFWSREWQEQIAQSQRDVEKGKVKIFKSVKEAKKRFGN